MGFLDDVFGDNGIAGALKETLEDTGWFFAAPAAAAVDLAKVGYGQGRDAIGGPDYAFKQNLAKAIGTGFQRGTQLFFGDQNGPGEQDDENNLINPGVGGLLDGLDWIYRKGIAQPYGTALITERRIAADLYGHQDNENPFDIGSAYRQADARTGGYGKGTSIGREAVYTMQALFGRTLTLSPEGRQALDEQSRMFDITSGTGDFMARLFYDPTIVGGKFAKGLRAAQVIREVKNPAELPKLLNEKGGIFAGFGERMDRAMEWNVTPNVDGKMKTGAEIYAAHRGLQQATDGHVIAQAMADSAAAMAKQGASKDEMLAQQKLIQLAGLNDANALEQIFQRTPKVADALAALNSQKDDLLEQARLASSRTFAVGTTGDLAEEIATRGVDDYMSSEDFLSVAEQRLKAIDTDIKAAQAEAKRQLELEQLFKAPELGGRGLAGTLTSRPLLASARGASTKGMEARAAKERGEVLHPRMEFVFQSSPWNKAVAVTLPHVYFGKKAVDAFQRTHAPFAIDFEDTYAPVNLNNFMKASPMDSGTRMTLFGEMAKARTEGAKRAIVAKAIDAAQNATIDKYVAENPSTLTPDVVKIVKGELASELQKDRTRLAAHVQRFSAHLSDEVDDKGNRLPGDMRIDPEDGLAHTYPLLDTQLQNVMVLPNMQHLESLLKRHSGMLNDMAAWVRGDRAPDPGRIKQIAADVFDHKIAEKRREGFEERTARKLQNAKEFQWRTGQYIEQGLSMFVKAWKYGMLLRPAYPMRVLIDSDLRALSVVGPKAFAMYAAPRAFGFATMGGASRIRMHRLAQADDDVLRSTKNEIENLEGDWRGAGNKGVPDTDDYKALKTLQATIENRLDLYVNGGKKGRVAAYGRFGEQRALRPIQTVAGETPGAFDGPSGRAGRRRIESETTAAIIGDQDKMHLKHLTSKSWTTIPNTDERHMSSWLHAVNAQLLQSDLGRKAVEFQHIHKDNPDEAARSLLHWMKTNQKGRELMGRLVWTHANQRQMSREVIGYVNHYLPTPELRERAFTHSRVRQEDLEAAVPRPDLRPPVHGEALAMATGYRSLVGKAANDWFERTMRWLADAPEDQLARHPLYSAVYEQEVKRRAEQIMANPDIVHLTGGDIRTMIQAHAHRKAQATIKRYMFDVATRSDLSHALRFVSPFISAWEDTVRKWGRIAVENPDIIGKAYLAWNAPNKMGLVVDDEGKIVDKDDPLQQKGTYIMLRWPSWLTGRDAAASQALGRDVGKPMGIPFVDTGINFRLPKQAINIILQGGLQPGFGPIVAYPVSRLQVAEPTLDDAAHLVNPYGPSDSVWDAIAPTTVKRIGELLSNDNKAFAQNVESQWMALLHDYSVDPSKFDHKPTIEDAKARAKWIGALKILNNSSNPMPFIFDSPYKFYVDAYRELQREERDPNKGHEQGWADEQFVKGYGESFFPLVQSLSKNNAGIGATAEAKAAADYYKSLIANFGVESGQPNSAMIRLIIGPDGEGEFNQSAHQWQLTHEISPGTGEMFRTYSNPQEAKAAAYADLGWYKYRQFMNQLDGMANDRGLATYQDDPELVKQRQDFIAALKGENEDWWVDWSQRDDEKFTRDLGRLGDIVQSPKFSADRTDIDGVRQYLALRTAAEAKIAELGVGPTSNDAQPVRQEFTDAVMNLVSANTKFSEWAFYQYLERDPLLESQAVPPEGQPYTPTWGLTNG